MTRHNKEGFSLIELLSAIVVMSLIFSIGIYYLNSIIINSKTSSQKITYDALKESAQDYVDEYKNDVVWDNYNKTCVSIETLVSKGLLNSNIRAYDAKSVIVTKKMEENILFEEVIKTECSEYLKKVKIPQSKDICNDVKYDNDNPIKLIKEGIPDDYSVTYDSRSTNPTKAGDYKIKMTLNNSSEKQWEDGSKNTKYVTCKIKKAMPTLEIEKINNSEDICLKSNVDGIVEIKVSNPKYVTAKIENATITATNTCNDNNKIKINTNATRNTNTYVTITLKPSDSQNYTKSTIIHNIDKIEEKLIPIKKPTENTCYNLIYNGNDQKLHPENNGYTIFNDENNNSTNANYGKNSGKYGLIAKLNYGYIWEDSTSNDITFTCEIKVSTPTITYTNAICNPQSKIVTFGKIYGEKEKLCIPNKVGYTFDGWYSGVNYQKQIKNDTEVVIPENHNLYAKWNVNEYTINYDCNGGTGNVNSSTHKYGENKALTTNSCSRTNYKFIGWNTKADGTGNNYTDNQSVINLTTKNNETITLYAMWEVASNDIKEFENGTYFCTETIIYSMGSLFLDENKNTIGILKNGTQFCYKQQELIDLIKSDCSGFLGDWPFASVYIHKDYVNKENVATEGDYVFGYIPLQNGTTCMTTLGCPGVEQFKKRWCAQ